MEVAENSLELVRARLGLGSVQNNVDGLREFYRAWCLNVPFDNLRKSGIMFGDPKAPLPNIDANVFFDDWLSHGIGGTCWQHGDAIYTAAKAFGFDARRGSGSMFDGGDQNHATVLVRLPDGSNWILDNAFLNLEPLRIDSEEPSVCSSPVHFAEVEVDGDAIFVHGTHPPLPWIFFRLLERDLTYEDYVRQWDLLGPKGPFNAGLHIRRSEPHRVVSIRGANLIVLDDQGLRVEPLDAEGIKRQLRETFGISKEFVEEWAASGALEASLAPASPPPPLPERVPPSKRGHV